MAQQGDPENPLGLLQSQEIVEKECQGADLQEKQPDLFQQQGIVEKDFLGDQEEKLDLVQEQEQHQDRKYSPANWSDTAWWTHGWFSRSVDQRLNPGSGQVHSDCLRPRLGTPLPHLPPCLVHLDHLLLHQLGVYEEDQLAQVGLSSWGSPKTWR